MSNYKTLDTLTDCTGKVVLVRADLNVPMQNGEITDTTRIDRFVPTVKSLVSKGAKVVVMSHFGRPKGQKNPEFTLAPVAAGLSKALGQDVKFASDCIGPDAADVIATLNNGDVACLENLRFYAEEEKNDAEFAKKIASLGEIYVDDAFSCSHRAHASIEAITHYLPTYAGLLMQEEVDALTKCLEAPTRPVAAVVGGAKISTKLDLLLNMVQKVDILVLGGGMANTFHFANGVNVGKSLCEADMVDQARAVMAKAQECGCNLVLPSDCLAATEFKAGADNTNKPFTELTADEMALDTGSASINEIKTALSTAKTVLWNGPLGAFEIKPFDTATNAIAQYVATRTQNGEILSVAGGGDTVSALENAGVVSQFGYISTAGGAFLEWLEGKELPGVAALKQAA